MSIDSRRLRQRLRQRGLSLLELIVFIVIVGAALAGVLSVMNITTAHSADPMINKQMLAIAESLMEEIQLKDFDAAVPTRSSVSCHKANLDQTTRNSPTFSYCVSDYDGFAEPAGIHAFDGSSIPSLSDYTVTVSVAAPAASFASTPPVPAAAIWVITVTVRHGSDSLTLTGYRFNYG